MAITRINYGRGHGYKIDGQKVPGVTTVINATVPKPALVNWAARLVAEMVADAGIEDLEVWRRMGRDELVAALSARPKSDRNRAAMRGTEIHAIAERVIHGEVIEETPELEPLWGHIESCVRFLDEWQPKPVLVEATIADREHGYAGTLDFVGDLPDGRRVLFDYKTGKSGIFAETALQLAGYRWAEVYLDETGAEKPLSHLVICDTYAVHLRADGYDVYPVKSSGEVRDAFFGLCDTYRHFAQMDQWIGDAQPWTTIAGARPPVPAS